MLTQLIYHPTPVNNEISRIFSKIELDLFSGLDIIIAGGSVRKALFNIPLGTSDVDVFFKSVDDLSEAKRRMYQKGFHLATHRNCVGSHISKKQYDFGLDEVYIQLICKSVYSDANKLISDFDWTVCQFAYEKNQFIYTNESFNDEVNSHLHFVDKQNSRATFTRLIKYLSLGYQPHVDVIERLMINTRDTLDRHSEELGDLVGTYDTI